MKKLAQSTKAQCERLLKKLQEKPCTTLEIRHQLDILGVAPRIFELRHNDGHNIKTSWSTDINPGGKQHRFANYVLLSGHYGEKNEDGISEAWRLDEVSDVRSDENYYTKYIAGAYGAVPKI